MQDPKNEEPFLHATPVEAIIAQRPVRLNCPHCARPTEPDRAVLAQLSTNKLNVLHDFKAGQGCDECNGTGFRGRTVIYELLAITDEIRGHILKRDPASALRKTALAQGMGLLRDNGAQKAYSGLTTPEKIFRVSEGITFSVRYVALEPGSCYA